MNALDIIVKDKELKKLLTQVFLWRPMHPPGAKWKRNGMSKNRYNDSCAHAVRDLAEKLLEKYDIGLEVYT